MDDDAYDEWGAPPDAGSWDEEDDPDWCSECADYGDWQCLVHGQEVLNAMRREGAEERRLVRRATRAGVPLTDEQAFCLVQFYVSAPGDPLVDRWYLRCINLRCRFGLELCSDCIPF